MPDLEGNKSPLESATIRSILVAALLVLGSLGVDWANLWDDEKINKLVEGVSALAVVVTLAVAARNRVSATQKIGPRRPPRPPAPTTTLRTQPTHSTEPHQ